MNARTAAAQREVTAPPAHRTPRLLPDRAAVPVLLPEHRARHGDPPYDHSRSLIGILRDAGLTGRDGTGRPVHAELTAVADAGSPGRAPVVYAHQAQGEPASAKDTALLWHSPQLVFDGLQLVAAAVGASRAFLLVKEAGRLREALLTALGDRARDGSDPVPAQLTDIPPRFSAMVQEENSTNPALVFEPGTGEVPALVQNVETLAHVALIARYGAAWFRAVGLADDPGTMLCTIRQPDGGTDIVEVPTGTLIGDIVTIDHRTQAVLVGGYHGSWLQTWQAAPMPLSTTVAGLFAALPADRCGLAETARVARYLAAASPRDCQLCASKLPRIAEAVAGMAGTGVGRNESAPSDLARLSLDCRDSVQKKRADCRHPDGTMRFIRSALRVFSDEFRRHERGGCRATTDRPFLPVTLGERPEEIMAKRGDAR